MRSESYRKALIWQKAYLISLLKGYESSQDEAILQIRNLNLNTSLDSMDILHSIDRKMQKQRYEGGLYSSQPESHSKTKFR